MDTLMFVVLIYALSHVCTEARDISLKHTTMGPVAKTKEGELAGVYFVDADFHKYEGFLGVPYANPPIGKLRWKDPQPISSWNDSRTVTHYASPCVQYMPFWPTTNEDHIIGSEDCLYLNIFYPAQGHRLIKPKEGWDVVVFFQGEAFMWGGTGRVIPTLIVERGLLFINVNYRLNIFGFLSTEDSNLPGNYGLKDQVMALQWIKRNIGAFGGNPESITLLGSSAGAASVHYHYLSPLSKGLFNRGISLGGTATCPWAINKQAKKRTEEIATRLGCSLKNVHQMVECLKSMDTETLAKELSHSYYWSYTPISPFGPVIEETSSYTKPFITEHPVQSLMNKRVADLPWLLSVTTHDGLFPVSFFLNNEALLKDLREHFNYLAPLLLEYNNTAPEFAKDEITQKIKKFYFGSSDISRHASQNIIAMVGDRLFVVEAERSARLQAAMNKKPVFMYQYGYRGVSSLTNLLSDTFTNYGAAHIDDALSIAPSVHNPTTTPEDEKITSLLLDIISSFAKNGIPDLSMHNIYFKALTGDKTRYVRILDQTYIENMETTDLGNREFWDSLYINDTQMGIMPKNV